jgi:hypothetical protein
MKDKLGSGPRLLIVLALICGARSAEPPPVVLEVVPNNLSLAAGELRRVTVVARIASPVRKLVLQARSDPGSRVTIGKPGALPEQVQGDVSWPVWIAQSLDGRAGARVVLQARYEHGDKDSPVNGLSQVVLEITVKQRPKVEDVATAKLEISLEKLEERRPRQAYLEVTNVSDVPVQIDNIRASLPPFAELAFPLPGNEKGNPAAYPRDPDGWYQLWPTAAGSSPLVIAPRRQKILHFVVRIPDTSQVLSGKHLMVFAIDLRYVKDGYSTEGSVVVSKEFDAGVLGETEFVGPTQVPFVLLPGFLFIALASLLFGKVWPKWKISFDYTKPETYLFGIAFSILGVVLYKPVSPWVYKVLWHRPGVAPRDYLGGYSIEDIINVWILAPLSALLLWTLIGGVWSLFATLRARLLTGRIPTPYDEPIDLIRKLARGKKAFDLVEVAVGGKQQWDIPLPSPDPAKRWVAGRIELKFSNPTPGETGQYQSLLAEPSKTQEIYVFLDGMRKKGTVTLAWKSNQRPELVAANDVVAVPPPGEPFLHEQV